MGKLSKLACLGEVMIELVAERSGEAKLGFAGDTYNTAVYLGMLSSNDEILVSYITALGDDHFSDEIIEHAGNFGIHTDCIERRPDKLPGLYAIRTDEHGERSFSYWRSHSAARTLFEQPCDIDISSIQDFDILYLSGISLAILPVSTRTRLAEQIKTFRANGGQLAFDSNYRPNLWEDRETARYWTSAFWAMTDIALPSVDDEIELFEDPDEKAVLNRLHASGINFGALKRGAEGPVAIGSDSTSNAHFERIDRTVDTTAAGDSFNAGFLHACMRGKTIDDAMAEGHELASKVVQHRGAVIDLNRT